MANANNSLQDHKRYLGWAQHHGSPYRPSRLRRSRSLPACRPIKLPQRLNAPHQSLRKLNPQAQPTSNLTTCAFPSPTSLALKVQVWSTSGPTPTTSYSSSTCCIVDSFRLRTQARGVLETTRCSTPTRQSSHRGRVSIHLDWAVPIPNDKTEKGRRWSRTGRFNGYGESQSRYGAEWVFADSYPVVWWEQDVRI